MSNAFKLITELRPKGDQPKAIEELAQAILSGKRFSTLLGVTGSGKTFTLANVIAKIGKPVLVISHNKTLAAQLYAEFKEFFPENAVEYFVSYYDYYQPEAYVPHTDTYIEKDASINDEIDKLRLSATSSLMSRRDVIIVASVSCIYGLGSPEEYGELLVVLEKGKSISREDVLSRLINIYYERNDFDFKRGTFRVRGETLEIFPAYEDKAIRAVVPDDKIDRLAEIDPLTGKVINELDKVAVYPAKHFVTTSDKLQKAIHVIEEELKGQLEKFQKEGKLLEAQRLQTRTRFDIEMLQEIGFCSGIENYSRLISGREPGSRPYCLIDYFGSDFLTVIDESHVTIPQIGGMYEGDRVRKQTLVDYGFRLPSALDNRPLRFDEFEKLVKQVIYVSATPGEFEVKRSEGVVEQLIRPTGIVDPEILVKPTKNQVDDLISEVKKRAERHERVLVTTLTKRMAEDLSKYLEEMGLKTKYLHSEIGAIERVEILRSLRLREFDCLVGINLLREGLDLPEVSLVAILDADKEGFLRSQTSLIQIAGRCARNINGQVFMYADTITGSMRQAIKESRRRRETQIEFNKKYKITPTTVKKAIHEGIVSSKKAKELIPKLSGESVDEYELHSLISELERDMMSAARNLQFEKAAILRDQIKKLQAQIPDKKETGIK
ncbi:MAG: excinuclease ABC subunit B [Candidatus Omnitrophica bacterium CG07_land_8_20_14_0_80_42_15]|uniref:UvrABC system protein B n=1 Tax=Candidatus Aquitaenariimonas noxiae TaxID=1974741 RepID=A0A2J0L2M0_9BACT|nr:MAG: excinuclease ABC subunit B [Candidatus Omnitrophica bacterium CG07_land_8_20_14_0_80_42_15]